MNDTTAASRPRWASLSGWDGDPLKLTATFPVLVASWIIGVGKNRTYPLIEAGEYPVRVLQAGGRLKVSKYDLLAYLGVPGYCGDPRPAREAL